MKNFTSNFFSILLKTNPARDESGFTVVEFMISALILLIISAAAFGSLAEIQRSASYQAEVQAVLNNSRIAMQTMERYFRYAGNDPSGCRLTGISLISPSEIRVQSDLTGSLGSANPNKGDPDGDIRDSGEDVILRFNPRARTLEVVQGGTVQMIASYISGLSMQYFDNNGNPASAGTSGGRIRVTLSAAASKADPTAHQVFGLQVTSNIQVGTG